MANNLHRWSNGVNLNSADINNKSVKGYQPNDYLESKVLNTILKECSLVSQMIGEYLGKSTNIDCNTTTDALLTQFTNTLNNLTVAKATDLNQNSITGNAVLYQNDDSTTSVLEAPDASDGDSLLTYNIYNGLHWVDSDQVPTSLSGSWITAPTNLINATLPGIYLVKAIVTETKNDDVVTTHVIDELFSIDDTGYKSHGKMAYFKLITTSQPNQDRWVACQLVYNGQGEIRLYVKPIDANTTVLDLTSMAYNSNYDSHVTLKYKKLK